MVWLVGGLGQPSMLKLRWCGCSLLSATLTPTLPGAALALSKFFFGDLLGLRREGVVILRMLKGSFKCDSLEVLTPTREAVHVVSVTSLGCEDIRQRAFSLSDDKSDLPFMRRDFPQ